MPEVISILDYTKGFGHTDKCTSARSICTPGLASGERRPGLEARAAHERRSVGRLLAGALQLGELHGPSPQATTSGSRPRTVPGCAGADARFAAQRLDPFRPLPEGISNQAPGKGERPRMWLWISAAARAQSMRVSAFSIFFA